MEPVAAYERVIEDLDIHGDDESVVFADTWIERTIVRRELDFKICFHEDRTHAGICRSGRREHARRKAKSKKY